MKVSELLNENNLAEDWGSSDWYPVMQSIQRALDSGTSLLDAAKDAADRWYVDMGYDTAEDAVERIITVYNARKKLSTKSTKGLVNTVRMAKGYNPKVAEAGATRGYDTSESNREYFYDYDDWLKAVRQAGGDIDNERGSHHLIRAYGHDGLMGEWEVDAVEGWLVDSFTKHLRTTK